MFSQCLVVNFVYSFLLLLLFFDSIRSSPTRTHVSHPEEINEESPEKRASIKDTERTSLVTLASSASNTLFHFDSSSSSDLHLSWHQHDNSSLSLTQFDRQSEIVNAEESLSLTIEPQLSSDDESVLYSRLPDELNIIEATLDSDLERIDRCAS